MIDLSFPGEARDDYTLPATLAYHDNSTYSFWQLQDSKSCCSHPNKIKCKVNTGAVWNKYMVSLLGCQLEGEYVFCRAAIRKPTLDGTVAVACKDALWIHVVKHSLTKKPYYNRKVRKGR